jgi:hypothetical protein
LVDGWVESEKRKVEREKRIEQSRSKQHLKDLKKEFDRLTQQIEQAKSLFRELLEPKINQRKMLFSRIYDTEKRLSENAHTEAKQRNAS